MASEAGLQDGSLQRSSRLLGSASLHTFTLISLLFMQNPGLIPTKVICFCCNSDVNKSRTLVSDNPAFVLLKLFGALTF